MTTDLGTLGLTLKRAQHRNHRAAEAALRAIGVTLVQWDALRAIDRMPDASGHDLALATFQSDQAFGILASRLVDRGLITRTPGRGRRVLHALTPDGRSALRDGQQITSGVLADLFSPLSPAEQGQLERLLTKLLEAEASD